MALFKRKPKETTETQKEEKSVEQGEVLPSAPSLPKGGDEHSYRVVLSPHITEKGTVVGEHNKYIFKVSTDANKTEIKKAVGNLYKVEVAKVHILHMPSKFRRVGKYEGKKPGFKKAIITLQPGNKIDTAI